MCRKHNQESPGANDMSVFVAATHLDTSLWRLLVLLNFFSFDSCPRRGGSQGARDSLFWFLLFLLFVLKWNNFIQPPAGTKFSFSPTPLPSLLLQSREMFLKKIKCQCQLTVTGFYFKIIICGFTCLKLSAIFYKILHYSSLTPWERNPLRGHTGAGRALAGNRRLRYSRFYH